MVIQKTRLVKEKLKSIVSISFIFDNNVYFIYIPIENKEKAAMKKQTRTFKCVFDIFTFLQ